MRASRGLPAALLAAALAAPALAAGDPRALRLERLLARYHELGEFHGAVLVAERDAVLLERGFGMANLEWDAPNTPATRFRIGSITKTLTAALVLRLAETKRLSLDAPLAGALPGYRADTGARVTIRHLLGHTSGIPSFTRPGVSEQAAAFRGPLPEFVKRFCSDDLLFEPGTRFRYSNGGYVVLAAVIERASGLPYEEALRAHVLAPLGMKDSGLDRPSTILPRRAAGYQRAAGGFANAPWVDPTLALSAGGLYSTVRDMAAFGRALVSDGFLSAGSRAAMATPGPGDYSLGIRVARRAAGRGGAERTVLWHGGRIEGFNSLLLLVPEEGWIVVLLHNADSTRLETIGKGVLDVLGGRDAAEPRRAFAQEVRAALRRGAPAADVVPRLKEALARETDLLDPEPEEVNLTLLGYELLGQGRNADALAVFRFTAEAFPKSWNAHDSLGEALAAAGRREEALASYRASLALNPENRHAQEELRRLSP